MSRLAYRKSSRAGRSRSADAEPSSAVWSPVSGCRVARTFRAHFRGMMVAVACVIAVAGCGTAAQTSGHSSLVASLTGPPQAMAAKSAAAKSCQGQISVDNMEAKLPVLPAHCYYQAIPSPKCGPGSHPETSFQGAVPLADRQGNFKGFSCNLQLVSKVQGQGGSWMQAWYGDCEYYDQALPSETPGKPPMAVAVGTYVGTPLQHPGVVVVDAKNPAHPKVTDYLSTPDDSSMGGSQGQLRALDCLRPNSSAGVRSTSTASSTIVPIRSCSQALRCRNSAMRASGSPTA